MSTMEINPLPQEAPQGEDDVSEPDAPEPDYRPFGGVFGEGSNFSFLNCTRCGALIPADRANISRHDDSHAKMMVAETTAETTSPAADSGDRRFEGSELAELVRESMKHAARNRGLRQVELARRADVSQKHLSQMFTGNAIGSMEAWSKLAAVMDCHWSVAVVDDD